MSDVSSSDFIVGFDLARPGGDETAFVTAQRLHDGQVRFIDMCTRRTPKFRRNREVHAQRARKLRRRGEYVHFLRWEHGHCIYCWGGPVPETFYVRIPPQ